MIHVFLMGDRSLIWFFLFYFGNFCGSHVKLQMLIMRQPNEILLDFECLNQGRTLFWVLEKNVRKNIISEILVFG